MRFITWFSPCAWAEDGGYMGIRWFWQETAVGRAVSRAFWHILSSDVLGLCNFDKHPETAKLKPWTEAFYTGTSFSILNYETDILELVRQGKIRVHIADISHLSRRRVHLADEHHTVLSADALLCVTGWKHVPPVTFLPQGIDRELGVPHLASTAADDLASQATMMDKADAEITSRFPRLHEVPAFNQNYVPLEKQRGVRVAETDAALPRLTPYMLYRFITPASPRFLHTRDIAFCGFSTNFSNVITAHIQGLWISAFFDGKLARDPGAATDSIEHIQYQTVLHNRMGKWRFPTDHGSRYPDFIFEAVSYLDMLLTDLGLRVHRKKGWFSEMTEPYGPEDYRNLNAEWEERYARES
jgi:hypothetical protein